MGMLSEIPANVCCFPWLPCLAALCLQEGVGGKVQPPLCPLSLTTSWQADIEQLDPRGRTPLHLATTLGHLECARVLLKHGADVGKENRSGWTGEEGDSLLWSAIRLPWHGHGHGHAQPGAAAPKRQLSQWCMCLLCSGRLCRATPCSLLLSALQSCRRL